MSTINLLAEGIVPCFVDGKAFIGGTTYEVRDPHETSKVLHQVSAVTSQDVEKILDIAEKASITWKATSAIERRRIFMKAANILRERSVEYAGISYAETTLSVGFSHFDCHLAVESLEEVACAVTIALRGEVATSEPGQKAYIERCPYGIVFGIAPWNAPLVLGQRACMQPIIAGNVAILKTSEMSPKTHMIIAQIFAEAGLPNGVLSIIHVAPNDAPAICEQIIANPSVGKVNFTGSTRVGKVIGALCGQYIKPVVLELGGKAPLIVCADANLEHVANAIIFGSYYNSGQICMATQTIIVEESIVDALVTIVERETAKVKASAKDGANIRGLFTQASVDRVNGIVKDAIDKGAKVAAGGWNKGEEGNVVQPLILKDITPAMRIYKEEMFSPVCSIISYKSEDEAIKIANDNDYGLAAAVWTKDTDIGYRIAKQINSGMVHINGSTVHDHSSVPHGGWKNSGFGKFNGIEGIREFTQIKVISINDSHGQYPI